MATQVLEEENPKEQTIIVESVSDLEKHCPIDLSRFLRYADDFDSHVEFNILSVEIAKRDLEEARQDLDIMISLLLQSLHKREIYQEKEDFVILSDLKENVHTMMGGLNKIEGISVISDSRQRSDIGYSHLTVYARRLRTIKQTLIESLIQSTKEYFSFEETQKIKREPRTFLYIFYQILAMTSIVLGAVDFGDSVKNVYQRGAITTMPMNSWQGSMTDKGQEIITNRYTKKEESIGQTELEEMKKAESEAYKFLKEEDIGNFEETFQP